MEEMKKRGIQKDDFKHTYVDVSHVFHLGNNFKAYATLFPRMNGIFGLEVQPNKDFGEDIFEKSMLITGIPREDHFHSDEFKGNAIRKRSDHPSRLPINKKAFDEICEIISPTSDDAFVVVTGSERKAMHAMKKIVERVKIALDGVPQETRRLLPNGNTEFLRVIHGKERIYPDTDTPLIVISPRMVEECRKTVGERPWEIYDDLHRKYGLRPHQVDLLIRRERVQMFHEYVEKLKLNGAIAYRLLIEIPRSLKRRGLKINARGLNHVAEALSKQQIILEQVDQLVGIFVEKPAATIEEALKELRVALLSEKELDTLIQLRLKSFDVSKARSSEKYRRVVVRKVVGEVLKSVKRSVPGRMVADKVEERIMQG
jgi:glutamyl-tRNA(Gln) amidotransferase subunit E